MKNVCTHCHTENYVDAFYTQYDDFVINYNEKFAKPGQSIMTVLRDQKLITKQEFDEEIEWTWFYLWHPEGRRALRYFSVGARVELGAHFCVALASVQASPLYPQCGRASIIHR